MRIENWLLESARKFASKTALITPQRRMTYAELDDSSTRLAAALAAQGVKRCDRVLVFMDNCWEAAVSIFAILKAGATFSPINPSTKADKLAYMIDNCRGAAILTTGKLMPVVAEARQELSSPLTVIATAVESGALPEGVAAFEDCLALAPIPVRRKGIDVDLAMLIYTSGSTGRPKGVMMTHNNIQAA